MTGDDRRPDAVVVPEVSAGSTLACVRSLGKRNVPVVVVAADDDAPAFHSKYATETAIAPSPTSDLPGYRDALLELAARDDVLTVVPLRESDAYVLSKHRSAFAEHASIPLPSYDTVAGVQDWLSLRESALAAGTPIPETKPVDEWERWDRRTVVKSRYSILVDDGRATFPDVRFFEAGEEPDVDRIIAEMGHVPVAQEFVPGVECGFFALFDYGEPVVTFQHRRVRSYTYAGGASVYRESVNVPELERIGTDLLSHLEWHGPAMVECKRDHRDGQFKLMEINPRFWGSLPLACTAGVEFPYLYYLLAKGVRPQGFGGYRTGVGSHVLRGEVSYLNSVLRREYDHVERPTTPAALWAILRSLYDQPHFDYFDLRDPGPFVKDFRNNLEQLAT